MLVSLGQLPTRQQLALGGIAGLALVGCAFVGSQRMRPVAPLVIQNGPAPTPVPVQTTKPNAEQNPEPILEPSPEPAPTEVVAHVVGAVKKPGLLRLAPGSRVDDAVRSAGGATADADLVRLNLAAKLVDGVQVYVPSREAKKDTGEVAEPYRGGETVAEAYAPAPTVSKPSSEKAAASGPKASPGGKVSLNTASQNELETLPGVGPSTAQKILDYRRDHGGFGSIDELMAVSGIGPKKLDKMRPFLKL